MIAEKLMYFGFLILLSLICQGKSTQICIDEFLVNHVTIIGLHILIDYCIKYNEF